MGVDRGPPLLTIWGCWDGKYVTHFVLSDHLSLSPFIHTEICHADTERLTQIYTLAPVRSDGSLFLFNGVCVCVCMWGEAKLDFSRDNSSRDSICLVGMISLKHQITYITTAACSAVCHYKCVQTFLFPICSCLYRHLCLSVERVLKGSVCLNTVCSD